MMMIMTHSHCTRLEQEKGQGNDGLLYHTMYCTQYTGTGTGNLCFLLYSSRSQFLSRLVCMSHNDDRKQTFLLNNVPRTCRHLVSKLCTKCSVLTAKYNEHKNNVEIKVWICKWHPVTSKLFNAFPNDLHSTANFHSEVFSIFSDEPKLHGWQKIIEIAPKGPTKVFIGTKYHFKYGQLIAL